MIDDKLFKVFFYKVFMFGKEEPLFNLYISLENPEKISHYPGVGEVASILGLFKVLPSGRLVKGYEPNLHTVSGSVNIFQGREGHIHFSRWGIKDYKIDEHGNAEIEVFGENPFFTLDGLYRKNNLPVDSNLKISEKLEVLLKELEKHGVDFPQSAPCEIYEQLYREHVSNQ